MPCSFAKTGNSKSKASSSSSPGPGVGSDTEVVPYYLRLLIKKFQNVDTFYVEKIKQKINFSEVQDKVLGELLSKDSSDLVDKFWSIIPRFRLKPLVFLS